MISSARTVTPNAAVSALERRRNFLSEVVIDYGPRDVLGRLFLKADTELRELGIELSFAPVEGPVPGVVGIAKMALSDHRQGIGSRGEVNRLGEWRRQCRPTVDLAQHDLT